MIHTADLYGKAQGVSYTVTMSIKKYKCFQVLLLIVCMLMMSSGWMKLQAAVINTRDVSKIIWCGDSRTVQMGTRLYGYEREDDGKTVIARHMVAKAGSTVAWARDIGYQELAKKLKKDKYKNAILIMNFGVNQITKEENSPMNYLKLIRKIQKKFPTVKIYIMSVNPVKYHPGSRHVYTKELAEKRTRWIKYFNRYIENHLPEGVKYIDTYHNVEFTIRDGIHYTTRTYKDIVRYVTGTVDLQ